MVQFLIWFSLVAVVLVVLLLPLLTSRHKQRMGGKLVRYQEIAEALLDGDLPRAREGLKSLIRSDTQDVTAYLRLARILRREGDLERAVALYRSLKARDVRERSLREKIAAGLAQDLFDLQRYDEARLAAAELKTLDRQHPLVRQVELHDALENQDWGRAIKAVDAVVRSGRGSAGPRPAQVRTLIACHRDQAGQGREARRLLEEALKDEPDYGPALLMLGEMHTRSGDHERAATTWKHMLRVRPQAAAHVIARIEKAYFDMGRFSDLGALYEDLATASTEHSAALDLGRARMALRRGETSEALRIVDELLEREPDCRPAHDWRMLLLLEADRLDEARTGLKDAADQALTEPGNPACPQCKTPYTVLQIRCTQCSSWLPDPFTEGSRA